MKLKRKQYEILENFTIENSNILLRSLIFQFNSFNRYILSREKSRGSPESLILGLRRQATEGGEEELKQQREMVMEKDENGDRKED